MRITLRFGIGLLLWTSCVGSFDSGRASTPPPMLGSVVPPSTDDEPGTRMPVTGADAGQVADVTVTLAQTGEMGARRLSRREFDNALRDLLGDTTAPANGLLPEDGRMPFDNVYTRQVASAALIEGLNQLAWAAVDRLLADQPRRDRVVGCRPAAPATDAACFRSFVARFGRLAFRRPLTADEQQRFEALAALGTEAQDFYQGVRVALVAFLEHGNMVYRVEKGTLTAEAGVLALNGYEMASRLSFFLWGTIPDDALLSAAERGELTTESNIRREATRMLSDPKAKEMLARFHAQWLDYENLGGALAPAMKAETSALLTRIVFEERKPWRDIFRYDKTFVSAELARSYGLPTTGLTQPGWVSLQGTRRRGLISQGSFLSIGTTANTDTSPTLRGKAIFKRLLCGVISPPPPNAPTTVNTGTNATDCKEAKYRAHGSGGCAVCHIRMDPIGFGLENYDREGRYRTTEEGRPQCSISGDGEVADLGRFNGPDGLGELLASSGKLETCLAEQVYRFAYGRGQLSESDEASLAPWLNRVSGSTTVRLDDLLTDIVAAAPFRHRREEKVQ